MERKEFLKTLGLTVMVVPLMASCGSDEDPTADTDTTTNSNNNGGCTTTPTETEGPYPTKSPSTLVLKDIKSDRTGVALTMNITIQNTNKSCAALEGALVDVWHCDKDGNYSEYASGYTGVHFLRGRQTTNSAGQVGFSTIYPGWYSGRAPHIHVHVYNSAGKSLLVTQIAFPKSVCDTVYTTSSFYSAKGKQDTTNETDNVFRDGFSLEMATVEGSVAAGYTLTHTINVEA